jgi:hypothetical protein
LRKEAVYKLNYPGNRQAFFRKVVNDLEADKKNILKGVASAR